MEKAISKVLANIEVICKSKPSKRMVQYKCDPVKIACTMYDEVLANRSTLMVAQQWDVPEDLVKEIWKHKKGFLELSCQI